VHTVSGNPLYLGIDIGGTGIKAALMDSAGTAVRHRETPTRCAEDPGGVLDRVVGLGRELLAACPAGGRVMGVGVGCPGRIDQAQGKVLFSGNLPGLTGLDLGRRLADALSLPVWIDNDVNVVALAEGWLGAARRVNNYVCITLGTGVGGALVLGDRLWRGAYWGAGEVGHMVFHPGGHPCTCGGRGCTEQYVSAKALTRRANAALSSLTRRSGGGVGGRLLFHGIREVVAAAQWQRPAETGPHILRQQLRHQAAKEAVEGYAQDLAIFLTSLQSAFDPELIVVGGGIVRLGYWWPKLESALDVEMQRRGIKIAVEPAHFGPRAGVIGAARLAVLQTRQQRRRHR
jgi:glucokinase